MNRLKIWIFQALLCC